jgi:hypothetical protein
VNSNVITFSREYQYDSQFRTYDNIWASQQGKGAIIEYQVGILIFPFVRTNNVAYNDFYKVACIDGELNIKKAVELSFYEQNEQSKIPLAGARLIKKPRVPKGFGTDEVGSTYYELIGNGKNRGDFDYLQVKFSLNRDKQNTAISGLVIPKWDLVNLDGGSFTFAVDFGTTNSHIAYKKGDIASPARPQSFSSLDKLLVQRLDKITAQHGFSTKTENYDSKSKYDERFIALLARVQRDEFIPSVLGEVYSFPFRTAVAQAKTQHVGVGSFNLFGNTNIAFSLNRRQAPIDDENATLKIYPDLKWRNDENTRERVKIFIQEVLYLIRSKVISEGSDPSTANLYWFTPLNMSPSIYQNLAVTWTSEFQRIFRTARIPISLSESEAPSYVVAVSTHEVMTIDIGGMTTDILYIEGRQPIFGSSFSFAGNAIYGDFPEEKIKDEANGFVRAFKEKIEKRLTTLERDTHDSYERALYSEARGILKDNLKSSDMSSDNIVSLFYSNPNFGFVEELRNSNDFKIIFLLQYAGILYHCAKLVDSTDNSSPGEIIFSGNGSKVFTIIPNQDNVLDKMASRVFAHVTGEDKGIRVQLSDRPKEASCEGALRSKLQAAQKPDGALKSIIVGENINWKGEKPVNPTYDDIKKAKENFSAADSEYYKFVDFFLEIYKDLGLADIYGIRINTEVLKQVLKNDEDTGKYHFQGIDWTLGKGAVSTDPIIETVFFYPLIGAINKISHELANKKMSIHSAL